MSHQYPLIYFCESFYSFCHTYFSLSFYGPFIFSRPLFSFHHFYLLISLRSHSSLPFMRAHFYMIYLITLNHANSLFYFLFLSYVLFFLPKTPISIQYTWDQSTLVCKAPRKSHCAGMWVVINDVICFKINGFNTIASSYFELLSPFSTKLGRWSVIDFCN